jgi:hypothetical protein
MEPHKMRMPYDQLVHNSSHGLSSACASIFGLTTSIRYESTIENRCSMQNPARQENLAASGACRDVTPEEVAHSLEFGWVKLTRFVNTDVVKLLLQIAHERMGRDADSNAIIETLAPGVEKKIAYFNAEYGAGLHNPRVRTLIEGVGRSGKALLGRSRPSGVRYFSDFYAPKLASSKAAKHGVNKTLPEDRFPTLA